MGFRIIDRKKNRSGAHVDPEYRRSILNQESERLFGRKDERHMRYRNDFADKAERIRQNLEDEDALQVLAGHAQGLIKDDPSSSPHSQLPVDIGTLLDLL